MGMLILCFLKLNFSLQEAAQRTTILSLDEMLGGDGRQFLLAGRNGVIVHGRGNRYATHMQQYERSAFRGPGQPCARGATLSTYYPIALNIDPLAGAVLVAVITAAVGAVVKVLTERALNRWVAEPRLAKPDEEFIL
jgi:hypothetical protein